VTSQHLGASEQLDGMPPKLDRELLGLGVKYRKPGVAGTDEPWSAGWQKDH
jgi:hypothetical protein